MFTQGSLPGMAPPVATDRLFLALFPSARDAAQLSAVASDYVVRHGLAVSSVEPGRLHVTLFHLGDYTGVPPALVDDAAKGLAQLVAQPIVIGFDQIGSFGNRRSKCPLVLAASDGNQALNALHKQLAAHLRASSLGAWTHGSYVPHMTVAYGKTAMPLQRIAPVTWEASEVLLIHSLLGQTRHIPLAAQPLA